MRCPDCGAKNPDEAAWCNQCLRRFGAPATAEEPEQPSSAPTEGGAGEDPAPEEPVGTDPFAGLPTAADASPNPPRPTLAPPAPVGTKRGPFTVTDGGVIWACPRCETVNRLDSEVCVTCGVLLREVLSPREDKRPQRDPQLTMLVSLAFPGVGHAYLTMWGEAVARAAIALLILAAIAAGLTIDATGSKIVAIVFALVAAGLWAVSAHDAMQEAKGLARSVILKGRMFLYLTLGVLGLLFLQLILGATTGSGT